jgi:hypothetical protein
MKHKNMVAFICMAIVGAGAFVAGFSMEIGKASNLRLKDIKTTGFQNYSHKQQAANACFAGLGRWNLKINGSNTDEEGKAIIATAVKLLGQPATKIATGLPCYWCRVLRPIPQPTPAVQVVPSPEIDTEMYQTRKMVAAITHTDVL